MKYNKDYLRKIKRVLQLRKFQTIEQYRKAVSLADQNGVSKDLHKRMHIYGNTAHTFVDIQQKRIIKQVSNQRMGFKRKPSEIDVAKVEVPTVGRKKKIKNTDAANFNQCEMNQDE